MVLLTTILSSLGSAGAGSLLKIISGWFDSRAALQSEKLKIKLADKLQHRKVDLDYQTALFGNTTAGKSGLMTRRIIAVMMASAFIWLMVWCAIYPELPLTTIIVPESKETGSILWGIYSWNPHSEYTTTITTGHLLILGMNQIGLMTGFYFTPGGRK